MCVISSSQAVATIFQSSDLDVVAAVQELNVASIRPQEKVESGIRHRLEKLLRCRDLLRSKLYRQEVR